jgi:hypothetical protein
MAMESKYKRDLSEKSFRSLENFRYNPHLYPPAANNKQLVMAKNLQRSYGIPEANILRLIMYVDFALHWAFESEIELYYSDLHEIADFEKEPYSIERVIFQGLAETPEGPKSFEITNPYLVDKLYYSLIELLNFQKIIKKRQSKKGQTSPAVIKKVANELHVELKDKEKLTGSKPLYVIGYIFSLYGIGFKDGESILTEKDFNAQKKTILEKGETADQSYLQYLAITVRKHIKE